MTTLTCIVMPSRIVHAVADTCIQFVAACFIHGCLTFHAITFIFMQLHAVACIDISIPCTSMKMKLNVLNVCESHLLMSFCFVLLMCGDLLVLFSTCPVRMFYFIIIVLMSQITYAGVLAELTVQGPIPSLVEVAVYANDGCVRMLWFGEYS